MFHLQLSPYPHVICTAECPPRPAVQCGNNSKPKTQRRLISIQVLITQRNNESALYLCALLGDSTVTITRQSLLISVGTFLLLVILNQSSRTEISAQTVQQIAFLKTLTYWHVNGGHQVVFFRGGERISYFAQSPIVSNGEFETGE